MAREDDIEALLAAVGQAPDDQLARASAHARSRRRWLRQQAAQSATMAGVLLSLAELASPVTLACGSWTLRGRLRSVTGALVVAEVADGVALLPAASITAVESTTPVADDRTAGAGPDLADVLATVAPERPQVRLLFGDGAEVAGALLEVGKDVATVRLTSSFATVRLSALVGAVLLVLANDDQAGSAQSDESDESGVDLASFDDFGSG